MNRLSRDEIKALLDQILEAIMERDRFFEENPKQPQVRPGASERDLAGLERHWQCKLPPTYRDALSVYNGIRRFWFDIDLLSTQEIIEDAKDTKTFQEFFPALYHFIFACGTESYDAFAFDPAQRGEKGEWAVVQVGDQGEEERFPGFDAFLEDYLKKIREEIDRERADRAKLKN